MKEITKTTVKIDRPERPAGRKRARSKMLAMRIPRGGMALRIYAGCFDCEVEKKRTTTRAQTMRKRSGGRRFFLSRQLERIAAGKRKLYGKRTTARTGK